MTSLPSRTSSSSWPINWRRRSCPPTATKSSRRRTSTRSRGAASCSRARIARARSARPRAPRSCPACCPRARASTTTPPNSPPTFRPSPIICARLGYRTVLSGKMHFCGPDQLHGFEARLTTDIYPADFGWTPDWDRPHERPSWYHNMSSVTQAGLCVRTNQLDFDDEVTFAAEREIYDKARGIDPRPLLLVASLTHPHDPYAITERLLGPLSRRRDRHARPRDPARAARSAFAAAAPCLRDGCRARRRRSRSAPRGAPITARFPTSTTISAA